MKRYVVTALLLGVVSIVAFELGVFVGQRQFVLLEGAPKAALLVGELSTLRGGKPEKLALLVRAKEQLLDAEIVNAMRLEDEGRSWVFLGLAPDDEYRARLLDKVAQYRRVVPSSTDWASEPGDGELDEPMQDYVLQVQDSARRLVEK